MFIKKKKKGLAELETLLLTLCCMVLAPVVQMLDIAIHQINHYPVDNYYQGNRLHYLLDRDLSPE